MSRWLCRTLPGVWFWEVIAITVLWCVIAVGHAALSVGCSISFLQ